MALSENASRKDTTAGWLSDTMRLSLFSAPQGWELPGGSLTEALLGLPPEMEQTSRRGATETRLEATKIPGFQVNVVLQGGRIDIHVLTDEMVDVSPSIVKPANEFRPILEGIIGKVDGLTTSFSRVAVGASLIKPCVGSAEVYSFLSNRFPCLEIDPGATDDFLYQVNPYAFADEVRFNRLERWSHGIFERIDIPVVGGGLDGGRVQDRLEGVKLDLDYNTGADPQLSFNASQASALLANLASSMFERMEQL